MVFAMAGVCACADTVTLKDGTVLEGDITAEDGSSVSIHLEFAGGTITETRHINKADIAKIVRLTPEQRAAEQLKRDYAALEQYQLNPNFSYRLDYYDQVVRDNFNKFLANHPDSPYASNITVRIAQWEVERDRVAAGKMKFHGQWLPAAEGARLAERERGEELLEQSRRLISQGRFESAVQRLQSVLSMFTESDLVSEAKPLLASAFQREISSLDHQRQQLETEVGSARQSVDRAQQAVNAAEGARQSPSQGSSLTRPSTMPYRTLGGDSQSFVQNQGAVNAARSGLAEAQSYLNQTRNQLDDVVQKLAALRTRASTVEAKWGIAASGSGSETAKPPPEVSPTAGAKSPDVLVGFAAWLKNYWVYMAGALVVLLFLLTRLTK
jgi:outer membrane protein assembly factor BamD (BamD/ComL family)